MRNKGLTEEKSVKKFSRVIKREIIVEYTSFGNTGMEVSRIGLGGFPLGAVNKAQGWDPYSEEGRMTALETINKVLDMGINYIDTAPGYGSGYSESLIGEVLENRRDDCFIATKVEWDTDKKSVIESVERSLNRLNCECIDVLQFHGGRFTQENTKHIIEGGPLNAMQKLKEEGIVKWIGFTTEEAWSGRKLIDTGVFDMVQVCYNMIYQSAANHLLDWADEKDLGVAVMRPMTSGILQRLLESLAPEWLEARDPYQTCLEFALSDSRVDVANVGMRWAEEVKSNVELVNNFEPPLDVSDLPRMTAKIYETEDEKHH